MNLYYLLAPILLFASCERQQVTPAVVNPTNGEEQQTTSEAPQNETKLIEYKLTTSSQEQSQVVTVTNHLKLDEKGNPTVTSHSHNIPASEASSSLFQLRVPNDATEEQILELIQNKVTKDGLNIDYKRLEKQILKNSKQQAEDLGKALKLEEKTKEERPFYVPKDL